MGSAHRGAILLTRCPGCGTTFRLRPEQLGQAQGRVRCGKCSFAFSAVEHRIDTESADEPFPPPAVEETNSLPPLPASAVQFSALGQRKRFVAQPGPATGEFAESGDVDSSSSNGLDGAALAPATDDKPRSDTNSESVAESPPEPAFERNAVADSDATVQVPDLEQPAAADLLESSATSGQAPQAAAPGIDDAEALAESTDHAEGNEAVAEPEFASDYLAGAAAPRNWPWVTGTLLLGAALFVQVAYAYRTELAKNYPAWRPALETACDRLGCTVELPRDAERVSIESSDLNPESDKKRLQLVATLKNRATYPQSYPHLELTLTDVRDQPLVRRVFAPGEYLEKGASASFGPNAEVAVKLMLEIDDVSASGYRVYLFYP